MGYGQLGRGRGRGCGGGERGGGGKGRDHHVIDVAHLAQEPATPRLTTVARSFELRAHVYVSFAHASGHMHCERFARDIGRFVAVVKVYWLARVARSAPAASVGGAGHVFRARTTASLISANYTAGRAVGVWAWGAVRKARAVVMAGNLKLPSAVRSVGFGDCGRGRWPARARYHVMREARAASSTSPAPERERERLSEREKTAQRGAPERRARRQRARPSTLATCAAWKALAWAAWPLPEPADAPGVCSMVLWVLWVLYFGPRLTLARGGAGRGSVCGL